MRFKVVRSETAILLVSATYITYLGLTQQLTLYIHPRYVTFTMIMAAAALLLLVLNTYFAINSHTHTTSRLSFLPLGLVIIFAMILPPRTLTSATVSQRSTDAGSLVSTSGSKPLNTLFAGSSRGLKLTDWSRLLASNQDPSYYENKPAKISGFVYDANLGSDTVWLARFVLTCCAVDAQPVGVPVQLKDWQSKYDKDEWLDVEGVFQKEQTADGEILVLVPTSINQIEQPRNPYAN